VKEQTIESYQASDFAKMLAVAGWKDGKTVFLAAGALGVLPWQKYGGVVDAPENLHIIACDAGAATGVGPFLEACHAPKEAYKARIYNLQDDIARVSTLTTDMDYTLYNKFIETIHLIESRAKGIPLVLTSSLTMLAQALERSIAGPPGDPSKGGLGMDQNKWAEFARQVNEIRNILQRDKWHSIWEGHVYKPPNLAQGGVEKQETLQVSGKAGHQFPINVEQVLRIRRMRGDAHGDTGIDKVYFDTRAAMDFVPGGRLFTERLDHKEADMTLMFAKLGLKTGRWGDKKKAKK
jgi:hypothetical protein